MKAQEKKYQQVNWDATDKDKKILIAISQRAIILFPDWDEKSTLMDIVATHLNGCPLKLKELLNAKENDFIHDVGGINLNMDRHTGKLLNNFSPIFSA